MELRAEIGLHLSEDLFPGKMQDDLNAQ